MNYDSPAEIKKVLDDIHVTLKKKWGQNFLVNPGAREKIIEFIKPGKGDVIWEIGPGLGAMTEPLLKTGATIIAFEIDWGMIRYLNRVFSSYPAFSIVQGDVVKTWKTAYKDCGKPDKVMGNLPYASASAIITSFVIDGFVPDAFIFTVQRELALRMAALPGTKSYSSFSILFQSAFTIKERQDIKPGSFYPKPEVVSSIISAVPSLHVPDTSIRDFFFHIVRTGFLSRRKTLLNNLLSDKDLKTYPPRMLENAIGQAGFHRNTRAEELKGEDFIRLAKLLQKLK
ncbi:MAG: ribosomal RNA small subunit methyltransferase A [Spirochaetales bacterium]|nr:ribosomal RNA small subunit methyltransferase A [Spirochaetales bacterium]